MRFDLTDLRLFLATARAGSISRGAQAIHLALAAASQRISGMEQTLGVPLLERLPRGVRPTAAGEAMLRHAEEILTRADRMAEELRGYATGQRGRVRLLANTGAMLGILPRALHHFLMAHPTIDVDVEEHPSIEIIRQVTEGGCELGVVADVVDPGGLQLRRLREDRLVLAVAAAHPLAHRDEVGFAEAAREPLVGLLDAALARHLAEHAARHGLRLQYRTSLRSVAAIGRMVEAGIGTAIVPASCLPELHGVNVRALPLTDAWARRHLALCLRDSEDLTSHARLLMEHITRAAASSEDAGAYAPREIAALLTGA